MKPDTRGLGVRVGWIGTFDPSFSRNRKLARLMEIAGIYAETINVALWKGDRVRTARSGKLAVALRAVGVYPRLWWRVWRLSTPDLYLISYPGWIDVLMFAFVARLKRRPMVFDPFFLLHETMVEDRRMFTAHSLMGRLIARVDRWAIGLADGIIADTGAHLTYFESVSRGRLRKGAVLAVGANDDVFRPAGGTAAEKRTVLFYGSYVPLQGIRTIVEAAKELQAHNIRFTLIGDGQERVEIERHARELRAANVDFLDAVPLDRLPGYIADANICLGIFGNSAKADRVIPHKLYECLAIGRPVVTRASRAVQGTFREGELVTVPPANAGALAEAISDLFADRERREEIAAAGARAYRTRFHEQVLAASLRNTLVTWSGLRE
jgi:glycosyltransferase involved in cell wall biosynthesis